MTTPFFKSLSSFLFIAIFLLIAFTASSDSDHDPVTELLALQSRSKSGIIQLNDHSVTRFLTSVKTPRPYWVLVFFDAVPLHEKPEIRLKEMLRELRLLASSFIANNRNSSSPAYAKLFFCKIEYKESQSSFSLFGVNALPHMRLVAPHQSIRDSHQVDEGDWSRLAESLADYIESKTNLAVGPIIRPPRFSRTTLILFAILFSIWFAYFVKRIIGGNTIFHDPRVWLAGSVFVYFFSVSGAMHNIIRSVPMYLVDRNDRSKIVIYYQGSGTQLGLEGFSVGFMFTIVGLLLGFITHGLLKDKNVPRQRVYMIFSLLGCFWGVERVVTLKNWKTGYAIHAYWPSRWS